MIDKAVHGTNYAATLSPFSFEQDGRCWKIWTDGQTDESDEWRRKNVENTLVIDVAGAWQALAGQHAGKQGQVGCRASQSECAPCDQMEWPRSQEDGAARGQCICDAGTVLALHYCSMRALRTRHSDTANLRRTYRLAFMRLVIDIWSSLQLSLVEDYLGVL
eukprot:scaffold1809_cov107-Cylindrotheca_fusiformis.AAC.2